MLSRGSLNERWHSQTRPKVAGFSIHAGEFTLTNVESCGSRDYNDGIRIAALLLNTWKLGKS